MYVEYDSNNSGGKWWLNDDDWKALEKAGWVVAWSVLSGAYAEHGRQSSGIPILIPSTGEPSYMKPDKDGRYLGALARKAFREGLSLRSAAEEWENITGKSATDPGCACCGQPHRFTEYDDAGKYVKSGPETSYTASW